MISALPRDMACHIGFGVRDEEYFHSIPRILNLSCYLEPGECYCAFQQNRAKQHTFNTMTELLKQFFGDRLIYTGLWTLRSPAQLETHQFFFTGTTEEQSFRKHFWKYHWIEAKNNDETTTYYSGDAKKCFQKSTLKRFNL